MASAAALEKQLAKLEKYGASQKAQDKVRDKLAKQREREDNAPSFKQLLITFLIALPTAIGLFIWFLSNHEPAVLTAEQLEDGRNYAATSMVERAIKGNLKDPSSYKYIGGKFIKIEGKEDTYRVAIFYSATNSFNARRSGSAWMVFTFKPGSLEVASTKAEKFD